MAMAKIRSPKFRVSFPAVFMPTSFEGSAEKYSVTMLFDKSTDLAQMKQLAQAAMDKKWPNKADQPVNMRHPPFRDGDKEKPETQGYANCIFVKASSKQKPGVVDGGKNPLFDETEFYAGCYARATLTAYAYHHKVGGKGVAFGLQNLQKLGDGDRFDGRSKAEDDFDAVETEAFLDAAPASDGVEAVNDPMFG